LIPRYRGSNSLSSAGTLPQLWDGFASLWGRREAGANGKRTALASSRHLFFAIAQSYLERIDDQRSLLAVIERIGRLSQREASCFAFNFSRRSANDGLLSVSFGNAWP
jgi:hypothetical protein